MMILLKSQMFSVGTGMLYSRFILFHLQTCFTKNVYKIYTLPHPHYPNFSLVITGSSYSKLCPSSPPPLLPTHTHLKNVEMLHTFTKRCSNATASLIQPPKINPNISQHCGSPVASVVCDERLLFNESHRETARIRSSRRKGESKQNLKMSMGQSV